MPLTPFHLGPGCAVKALTGRYFSLTVFGFAQVITDLEVLVRLLRGDRTLHGYSHTYLGATLIAVFTLLVGRPVCQWLLNSWKPEPGTPFLNWLRGPPRIGWPAAVSGAFLGTYSHVALDGLAHADVRPFAPFAADNALLGLVSVGDLYRGCVAAGLAGLLALLVLYWREPKRPSV